MKLSILHSLRRRANARPFLIGILLATVALVFAAVAGAKLNTAVIPNGDIGVTKTGPDNAAADTDVTYTITVDTVGPDDIANATMDDDLPSGLTFVSLDTSGAPGWSCSTPSVGSTGSISCANSTAPADSSFVFTLTAHIPNDAPPGSFITNFATVKGTPDNADENDSSTATLQIPGNSADLTVTKTGPPQVHADSDVTYTITVTNPGPGTATNATLQDDMPFSVPGGHNMTFVSVNQTSGPSWNCSGGATTTCSIGSLPPGSSVFTLVGHVPAEMSPGALEGTQYTNVATIGSDADPDTENNSNSTLAIVHDCFNNQVVTTNADSGAGSLRQAIADACAGSTITFDMSQVVSPIVLVSGQLVVNKGVTIRGPGANLLTISGNSSSPIFNIPASTSLTITDLTVTSGITVTDDGTGAGFFNAGSLTLARMSITGNTSAADGGGIYNSGNLTVYESTFSGNTAGGFGGAIENVGNLTIAASTFVGNGLGASSIGGGGAVHNSAAGVLTVSHTTMTGNTGGADGGGAIDDYGQMRLTNSIFSGNTSPVSNDVQTAGASPGSVTIDNCLISNATGLGALGDYGGSTQTVSLLPGSNAFDAATPITTLAAAAISSDTVLTVLDATAIASTPGSYLIQIDDEQINVINVNRVTNTLTVQRGANGSMPSDHALGAGITFVYDQRDSGFPRSIDGPDADTNAVPDIGAYEAQFSVEDIGDQLTAEDTQLQFTFNLGGAANVTSVTATSSNTTLVPNDPANLAVSGSGSTRTLTIHPAADQFGNSTITVTVTGMNGPTVSDTFTLNVTPVADTPTAGTATTFEDTQTGPIPVTKNANDGAEVPYFKVTAITNGLLFYSDGTTAIPVGSFVQYSDVGAGLKFTPFTNLNSSSAAFGFTVQSSTANSDEGLGGNPATAIITVTPVNDAPSFTKGADQTVNEDAGPQSVAWATAISAGPADEAGQNLTFQITNNTNTGLFSAGPAINSSGTLSYTTAANANGSATITVVLKDDGGTANGGVDTSAPPQTFTITVTPVNDPPSFTKGADQTVNEDAGPQSVAWATAISAGPPDEAGQNVTFQITNNTNTGLFSVGPAISSTGTLTYTTAPNANGSATITVVLKDDGGVANGGVDTSAPQSFTINVTPVNDAPGFNKGPNQNLNEDAGPQSVPSWATAISAGPANESGQTVSFQVTNNTNPAMFSAGPAISSTGTLTYTPAANANGIATVTFVLKDNGGTANGGVDTSAPQSVLISVNAVNDPPTFTKGPDVQVATNAGPQSIANWATGISAGPPDESGQNLVFHVTVNSNSGLFQTGPDITSNGTLTFTPAPNVNGASVITINLQDSGGTSNGGQDTSPTQSFTINVNCGTSFVTNSNDSGAGSLRDVILQSCPGATITFDMSPGKVTNPITLTSGEIQVTKNLTIQGPGADVLTVQRSAASGTPAFRIFNVGSGVGLSVAGLTISNGDSSDNGGAITNAGNLNLQSMVFSNNHSSAGASVLANDQTGAVIIANSTLSNNRANIVSAIYNAGGSLTLTNTTIAGNVNLPANNGPGAAIFNEAMPGVINITNCTISQNSGSGEAVFQNPGNPGAQINLQNTIVSGNPGGDVFGANNKGNNLIGGNALLAALGNYGGPTPTMALLPGSPAINAGNNTLVNNPPFPGPPFTDQRGFNRIVGPNVDIGAFESRGFTMSAMSGTPQSATILSAFGSPLAVSVSGVGSEPVDGGVVVFTAPASGATAALTGGATSNATISAGRATTNATANGLTGSYTVSAAANGATSTSFSLTNTKAATTTALTSSLNPSDLNQNVTFTAKVTSIAPLTGSVQFTDNGSNLGSPVTVDSSGVAKLTISSLTAGNHTIAANYSGDANFQSSSNTLTQQVLFRPLVKFQQPTYSVNENGNFITITVIRGGDTNPAVTVDYATPDDSAALTFVPCSTANGVASPRCDFTTAAGTLRFGPGETSKTFNILISQDLWVEGNETLPLTLSNLTGGAAFQQPGDANAVLTIVDDDLTPPTTNAIDNSDTFVRQHYHDFLNREADAPGLAFWTNQIESCGADQQCRAVRRNNVSAAFFLSIEFQNTGYFVERMYKAGFGDIAPPTVPVPIRFTTFQRDTQDVQSGIVVGVGNWQAQLDANKKAYALAFVQRPAFLSRYPSVTSAAGFVDSLNANAGMVLSDSERSALITELSPNPSDPALRADVLQKVAENAVLQQREFNRAFVLMQYFGYLRRNPDAAPEPGLNFNGYNFWLGKLNQFNGDYIGAEMIKGFITSGEYRGRFGP